MVKLIKWSKHIDASPGFRAYRFNFGNGFCQGFSQYPVAVGGDEYIVFHAGAAEIPECFDLIVITAFREFDISFPTVNLFGAEIQTRFNRAPVTGLMCFTQAKRL